MEKENRKLKSLLEEATDEIIKLIKEKEGAKYFGAYDVLRAAQEVPWILELLMDMFEDGKEAIQDMEIV